MLDRLPGLTEDRFIGEPTGRDTLNAVAYATGVLHQQDADATVAVFTADHIIEPVEQFQKIVERGFELAESHPDTLVTFGIAPTHAATGYGYLQLGDPLMGEAKVVSEFKEKPDAPTAETYHAAGSEKYLWNSGMFVWKSSTLMNCVKRFAPENFEALQPVLDALRHQSAAGSIKRCLPEAEKSQR